MTDSLNAPSKITEDEKYREGYLAALKEMEDFINAYLQDSPFKIKISRANG